MSKKTTRRAMLTSVVALALCFAMLIGTTYAWFTDSVASSGNIIKSGTLDIDLLVKGGDIDPTGLTEEADPYAGFYSLTKNPGIAVFNYDLWEPGYTDWANAAVVNKGTLALKYTLRLIPTGEVSILADVIDVYYKPAKVDIPADRSLTDLTKIGTLRDVINGEQGTVISDTLLAGQADYATIVLVMQQSAGNEYQNLSIGSDFTLQVLATQYNYEPDSFDKDYDKTAEYDYVIPVNTPAQLGSFVGELNDNTRSNEETVINMAAGTYNQPITIEQFPNDAEHNDANNGYVANIGNADSNIVVIKGSENTVVTETVTVQGAGNSGKSGYAYLQQSNAGVLFDGVTFEGTLQDGDVDTVMVDLADSVTNITFKNCTFKNQTHIRIGNSGGKTAGLVVFENCTFDKAACFSGYWYELQIKNCTGLVDSGHGKGLINTSGSGITTVENCTFDVGNIAYFVRTSSNGSNTTFTNCTFTGTPTEIVNLRGANQTVTFTGCTLNDAQIPSTPVEGVDSTDALIIN